MSKVKILPPHIIAKIAAGEVVERPASVVKELLENAIDAGATSLEIQLKDAGKTEITIKDNGSGIAPDDLELIFERHATSKISNAEDLFAIHSLGFRGEALYSIAAIADIELNTRIKDTDAGWIIHLRGGKKIDHKPSAKSETGTDVSIRELFFNTPARKKFLKTNTTEFHQILNTVTPYCLLHPNIRFRLTHQDKDLLDLAPTKDAVTRIADVLQLNPDNILNDAHTFKDKNLALRMFLGDMNIRRARRDMQFIFVNGRPVHNKQIAFHINQVYRLLMPQEHIPFFAVFLELPPEDVDAHVHPTKGEVRIRNETAICSILRHTCEQVLMQRGATLQMRVSSFEDTDEGNRVITEALSKSTKQESPRFNESFVASDKPFVARSQNIAPYPQRQHSPEIQEFFIPDDNQIHSQQEGLRPKLKAACFIGAFADKYLLFESGKSLLLIDQHAAQERISYETLIQQMNKGTVESQRLLTPLLLNVSAQEMLIWEDGQKRLDDIGFETTLIDNNTIAVHSYPQLIKDIENSVRQLLGEGKISVCDPDTIARRACRSSVMTGDKLHANQVEYQRKALLECLDPFTCPHGRPIVVEMSMDFLDKQFLRK